MTDNERPPKGDVGTKFIAGPAEDLMDHLRACDRCLWAVVIYVSRSRHGNATVKHDQESLIEPYFCPDGEELFRAFDTVYPKWELSQQEKS